MIDGAGWLLSSRASGLDSLTGEPAGIHSAGDGVAPPHRLTSRLRALLRGHLRAAGGRHRRHPGSHRRPARRLPAGRLGDDPPARDRGPGRRSTAGSSSPRPARSWPRRSSATTASPSGSSPTSSGCRGPRPTTRPTSGSTSSPTRSSCRSTSAGSSRPPARTATPSPGRRTKPPDYVPLNQLAKGDDFTVARIPEELEFTPGCSSSSRTPTWSPDDGPGHLNHPGRHRHGRPRRPDQRHRLLRQRPHPRPPQRLRRPPGGAPSTASRPGRPARRPRSTRRGAPSRRRRAAGSRAGRGATARYSGLRVSSKSKISATRRWSTSTSSQPHITRLADGQRRRRPAAAIGPWCVPATRRPPARGRGGRRPPAGPATSSRAS